MYLTMFQAGLYLLMGVNSDMRKEDVYHHEASEPIWERKTNVNLEQGAHKQQTLDTLSNSSELEWHVTF